MPTIKNLNQLEKIIEPYIIKAMELTRDKIFETISKNVIAYYSEPVFDVQNNPNPAEPEYYNRTGQLLESLTASHVTKSGGNISCKVGWDDAYLMFRYPGGFEGAGVNKATGLQVLLWMDSASHGGVVEGSHNYFSDAIEELGDTDGIIKLFKNNLKKVGLPIN